MAHVRLERVIKRFGGTEAVKEVSFEVEDREFVVMLGPSGCGKTTTLRCIAGLEDPDGGEIYIDGSCVNGVRPADRNIAFVFQYYALYPHLTVYDNIAFPLRTQGVPRDEVERSVRQVARILHLEEHLSKKPGRLSGGEMQRVALGRAMVRRPQVFLMDEPLSTLDAKLREEMRTELKRLQSDIGATTIYVTHDQMEAMAMGDRIIVMDLGTLQQVGTPIEVYDHPANLFVANFIGSPGMNFIPCIYREGSGGAFLALGSGGAGRGSGLGARVRLSGHQRHLVARERRARELVVGVRPEDCFIFKEAVQDSFEVEVYVLEPLGNENIVDIRFLEFDGPILKVRTPPTFTAGIGERVWVRFDTERIHVFDKTTGGAIF